MLKRTHKLTRSVLTCLVLAALTGAGVRAQDGMAQTAAPPAVAAVPFGPGEALGYRVTLGFVGKVGTGELRVAGVDTVRGHLAYHIDFTLKGGIPFAHVDDRFESWLDVGTLNSLRFVKDQREVKYVKKSTYDFFPERRLSFEAETNKWEPMPTDAPLDEIGFLFYVRTLPLKVGDVYTLDRYFKASGNPVTLKVLRKETVTVPAGTFHTIVVQPFIKTSALFGEGGEAKVFFSDDDRRMVVQLTSHVPILKSLNLYLETFVPGEPLSPQTSEPSGPGQ